MTKCAALNCENEEGQTVGKSFFRFPDDNIILYETWVDKIRKSHWRPLQTSVLCSDHFAEHYLEREGHNPPRLKSGAIPTIFNYCDEENENSSSSSEEEDGESEEMEEEEEEEDEYNFYINLLRDPESKRLKREIVRNIRQIEATHTHMKSVRLRARAVRRKINRLPLALVMIAKDILTEEN